MFLQFLTFNPLRSICYSSPLNPCSQQPDFTVYTVQNGDMRCLVSFFSLPSHPSQNATYPSSLASGLSCSLPPLHLGPLPPLCTYANSFVQSMCCPHTAPFQHRTPPLFSHFCSPGTPKNTSYTDSTLFSIHLLRSCKTHNLYQFPTLSIVLSMSFQNLSLSSSFPSLGLYPTITQKLTLENLNLIHRILELTHLKSITALCHTSFNRTAHVS